MTGSSSSDIKWVIDRICAIFGSHLLGPLSFFLGIEATRTNDTLALSQASYASDLLQKFQMHTCKPASTPLVAGSHLSAYSGELIMDITLYLSMVGGLQYLTLTRPDIAFAVNQVCQFMHAPRTSHLQAVKRILRFVKGILSLGLSLLKSPSLALTAYSDSDWAGDPDDRRSTTGACIFIGSNLVAWTAKKQSTVSRSSSEAEYRALATTTAELKWFSYLFRELGIFLQPPTLCCDNMAAIHMSRNPVFHARTRHVEIDYHFVRELQTQGFLQVRYVSTRDQLADLFTKGLARPRLHQLSIKLQLNDVLLRLRGGDSAHIIRQPD